MGKHSIKTGNLFLYIVLSIFCLGIGFFVPEFQRTIYATVYKFDSSVYYSMIQKEKNTIEQKYVNLNSKTHGKSETTENLNKNLTYGCIDGIVNSLNDKHTQFLNAEFAENLLMHTKGNFFGIGALLQHHVKGARVVKVYQNTPAEKSGLKTGDIIFKVNYEIVEGTALNLIVDLIKGEENTEVKLGIIRTKNKNELTLTAVRGKVEIPSVDYKLIPKTDIGYIEITNFADNTLSQFDKAFLDLQNKKIKGLVIDLRGNPGGVLQGTVQLLSKFVSDKIAVTIEHRGQNIEVYRTQKDITYPSINTLPITILVNNESASASEIFSGVLKDYKMATIIGERTYGKSSVQNMVPLSYGCSLKVTTAKYILPLGRDLARIEDSDGRYLSGGLHPDIDIKLDFSKGTITLGDIETDNQLQKCVEVLKQKMH